MTNSRFIIMTSVAHVPAALRKFGGRYANVAVVELDEPGVIPAMISEHAKGVRRIVRHLGAQAVGSTERCAFARALKEAEALAASLNAEAENV